jgi:uncharacterized phage-like protein YoqJ
MVDNSDVLVAVFNNTSGGTKNCFNYALNKNKKIYWIKPHEDFSIDNFSGKNNARI